MDIYWFLRLHDFLRGGGVPSSPPCFSSLLVPVSPTLWVRKLAPVLLPAVALLHPELARPTVLLPTNVSSTVVPAVPATSVLVMSIMVAVPPMEAVVVMVVVVEVPHGSPAPPSRTAPEASSVEVLISAEDHRSCCTVPLGGGEVLHGTVEHRSARGAVVAGRSPLEDHLPEIQEDILRGSPL